LEKLPWKKTLKLILEMVEAAWKACNAGGYGHRLSLERISQWQNHPDIFSSQAFKYTNCSVEARDYLNNINKLSSFSTENTVGLQLTSFMDTFCVHWQTIGSA
jgi:hypothetical protein